MPKLYRSRGGYRTAAVWLRESRCGPDAVLGAPSRPHTATASSAQVKMVQATNRFRIKPSPSVV
ncbi:hypothetical protein BSZ19_34975 [Bradyrhizobium japonicum]|uniref:Uncharacterized protein n=1 Tax=Bradyrhizobium japonicum TaxID=375 RepID=A0A1Y2JI58_BRAJP|nr:hypothetical protein BSZ19_34975 [Bradyrhizobium japonicum]